jgi:hypothetical protein
VWRRLGPERRVHIQADPLGATLAKLDIKDARIEAGRGAPKGTLPEGEAVHHYWDTVNAPFPWPWEVWEVKG